MTKLLQLPDEVQQSIMDGSLSERDTRIFHNLTNRQQRALHRARVVDGVLSQAETRRVADYIKRGETQSVSEAIVTVQAGKDKVPKDSAELAAQTNQRSVARLAKSLDDISAEIPPSDKQLLLSDLEQIQRRLNSLIKTLKA